MRSTLHMLAKKVINSSDIQLNQIPAQTIYLTHVKWITGKIQLERYFKKYGQVKHVTMFFDSDTGLHRGYASVTFSNKDSARRAMEERPHVIDGDQVDVEPFIPQMKKRRQ